MAFSLGEPLMAVPAAATFGGFDAGRLDAFLTMERAKNKRDENVLPDEAEVRENDGRCLIEYSFNEGEVSAALNAGGIVGNMSFEMSADPEADVEFDGDFSLSPTVGVNAAIRACYSVGAVKACLLLRGRDCRAAEAGRRQGLLYVGGNLRQRGVCRRYRRAVLR